MHNLGGKSDRTSEDFCRDFHISLQNPFLVFCMVHEILSRCSQFALLIIFDEFCSPDHNSINIQQMFSSAYPSFQLAKEIMSYQT